VRPPLNSEFIAELRVPARPERLRLVRALVSRAARSVGCDGVLGEKLVIAVNEACMNVIQHAYGGSNEGELSLEIYGSDTTLFFRLTDRAAYVELESVRSRDLENIRPGGLGVHFIREIMDECEMGHLEGDRGNYLEMVKTFK
jgi:sigma-B regulation protein RsbU (phosphoserine phosphatase)